MKPYRLLLIVLALLLANSEMLAQKGVIKGRVYDAINNEALPFVNVAIENSTIGAVTDLDGNFIITGLKPDFYRVTVSFIGYKQAFSDEIQVTNNKVAYVEMALQQSDTKIEEVVVKASPFRKTQESPVSLRTIGLSEIENNPGSNRDISRVIQSFPGVGAGLSYRNDIIVRGGGPTESRFYLDGVEIPTINHFATQGSSGGSVGIINADFVSSVNYYSGAFPSNRGNALSGVFEFTQIDGNKDKLAFSGVVGASDLALTIDGPIGEKTTFIASARQSYLQFLFDVIGLPFLPTFNDFQIKTRTRIDEKNELIFIGLGALDRFKLNTGIENPTEEQEYILSYLPVQNQWNYTNGLVYKHFAQSSYYTVVLSRSMLNNTSYKYFQNDESDDANKTFDYTSQEMENKLRIENTSRINGFKINVGLMGEYSKYNNSTFQKIFIENQLIEKDYFSDMDLFKWGLNGQVSKSYLEERLNVSFGFRLDANNYSESMQNMFEQFSPRFSAAYFLTDKISFNFNTGRYFQLPAYTTLGYRDNNNIMVNKENNLKYIQADHLIGGIEYNIRSDIQFTVESFYKQYDKYPFSVQDQINIANKGADFGVVGDEEVVSTGKGRAYGLEVLNRYRTDKGFTANISYTLVRSEFEDANGQLVPSSWDSKHLLTLSGRKDWGKDWSFGFKWRFVGGYPYTPYDLETSQLVQAWDIRNQAYLDYDRLNVERLNNFHQLDVRLDKKFFFDKWSLMLYTDIQNAYNFKAKAPDYLVLDTDASGNAVVENPTAPIAEQRYRLKNIESLSGTVLPTIGIMVKF